MFTSGFFTLWVVLGVFSLLVAAMFTATAENQVRAWIIAIFASVVFSFLLSCAMVGEAENDQNRYNGGICSECGSKYEFAGGSRYRSTHEYYYTCDNCGHTIKVNSIMK